MERNQVGAMMLDLGFPADAVRIYGELLADDETFKLAAVRSPVDLSAHRWTVDTPEDYELVRRIYDELGRDDFSWRDALAVVEAHPDWPELNRDVTQKSLPHG